MHHDSSLVPRQFSGPASPQLLPDRSNGLALGEGAVLLVGLTLLDYAGAIPFTDWPVHPFLFAVVLLSAQYGIHGGILAALGAIGLSHIDGWPSRPIDMSYAAYFGYVWADALSWMLAGLMVGAVTSNRSRVMQEQAAKLRKATLAESLTATQYEVLAQRTHQLERQLASHTDTGEAQVRGVTVVRPRPKSQPPECCKGRLMRGLSGHTTAGQCPRLWSSYTLDLGLVRCADDPSTLSEAET